QAEDGIRVFHVTGVQTCALPICLGREVAADRAEQGEGLRVELEGGGGGASGGARGGRGAALGRRRDRRGRRGRRDRGLRGAGGLGRKSVVEGRGVEGGGGEMGRK